MWGFCSVVVQCLDCMVVHAVLPTEKSGGIYLVYSVNSSAQTTHNSWPPVMFIQERRSGYAQIKIAMCNRKSRLWGWSVILSAMYRVIVYSCVSALQTLAL